MSQYYCLIAGLPDIHFDDPKPAYRVADFKNEVFEQLSDADRQLFNLFYLQYDNANLFRLLQDRDAAIDSRGVFTADELIVLIDDVREGNPSEIAQSVPYLASFIRAYLDEVPLIEGVLWQDQLTTLYYEYARACKNRFVSDWFELNLNINNILTALTCRRHDWEVAPVIVGNNDTARLLRTSSARDFGLSGELDYFESIQRIAETSDLYERERKIDLFKWRWLEEHSFFDYFTIERIFAYLLQLSFSERWFGLSKEMGEKRFREMIAVLKKEVELPVEFQEYK